MKFHFPSFALGVGVGVAGVLVGSRLRPVIVEGAASAYGLIDAITGRIATFQEDVEDVLAEARARSCPHVRARHADRTPAHHRAHPLASGTTALAPALAA